MSAARIAGELDAGAGLAPARAAAAAVDRGVESGRGAPEPLLGLGGIELARKAGADVDQQLERAGDHAVVGEQGLLVDDRA